MTHWKSPSCWERLWAEEEGNQRMRWLDGIISNGHELGQTSEDGEGQRGLVYVSPRGRKGLDTTGRLNNDT